MPKLGDYLSEHLSDQQRDPLHRLKDRGFDIVPTGKGNTIRIKKTGRDYGYINSTVIGKHGIFGYRFETFDGKDACPEELVDKMDDLFSEQYGGAISEWIWHRGKGNRKHKKYLVVTDIRLAEKILRG